FKKEHLLFKICIKKRDSNLLSKKRIKCKHKMGNTNMSCNDAALVITEGGDNTGNHPSFFSITRFVGIQAKTSPHKIAVKFGDERLTYRELEHRSNQLAHFLRSKGVKEEIIVPLMMERSLEMIISILGILKAGGAYAPIDPKYPQERV